MGEVIRLRNGRRIKKPKTRAPEITEPLFELQNTFRDQHIVGIGAFTVDKKRGVTLYLGVQNDVIPADMFHGLRELKMYMSKSLSDTLDD